MNTATQTIPEGYKQTELGKIPDDWDVKELGEVGEIKMCRRIFNHETMDTGIIPFYKIGTFGKEADAYISPKQYEIYRRKFSFPKKGDVLISAAGTIGRRIVYDGKPAYFQDSNIVWIDNNHKLTSNEYLYYVFQTVKYNTEGGTIQRLYNSIIKSAKFICPPEPQQKAIYSVLSDFDNLIKKLEKLIAKKKAIKQGMMQELLTGKRRLPGFSGLWVTDSLPNVCWFQEGPGVRTYQFTNSGTKLLNGTNINKNILDLSTTERFISNKQANGMYAHFLADENDIVIASSGITIDKFDEKVAFVNKSSLPLCMNTSTIRFKVFNSKITRDYLYYILQSSSFKKQIGGQATGSAQLNFGPFHLKRVEIYQPKDEKEQTAIATILRDFDSEIFLLEQKLEKYNQIMQGAMQVLLTGKIRLIKN